MRAASYVAEIDNINSPSDFISFYLVVPSLIKPGLCISWIQYIISVVRVDWTMGDGQLSGSQWMDLIVWIIRSIIIRYFFIGKHLFSNKRRELWRTRLFLSPLLFNLQECLHRQKELNVRPTLHFWQWREDWGMTCVLQKVLDVGDTFELWIQFQGYFLYLILIHFFLFSLLL